MKREHTRIYCLVCKARRSACWQDQGLICNYCGTAHEIGENGRVELKKVETNKESKAE